MPHSPLRGQEEVPVEIFVKGGPVCRLTFSNRRCLDQRVTFSNNFQGITFWWLLPQIMEHRTLPTTLQNRTTEWTLIVLVYYFSFFWALDVSTSSQTQTHNDAHTHTPLLRNIPNGQPVVLQWATFISTRQDRARKRILRSWIFSLAVCAATHLEVDVGLCFPFVLSCQNSMIVSISVLYMKKSICKRVALECLLFPLWIVLMDACQVRVSRF